jgi:hypothetical protein
VHVPQAHEGERRKRTAVRNTGNQDMIGYQWTLYSKQSAYESDSILAAGITDNSEEVKSLVEVVLAEAGHAAWGLLLRVAMDSWSSFQRASQTANWPSAGEIWVCKRASDGSFQWGLLFPRDNAGDRPVLNAD